MSIGSPPFTIAMSSQALAQRQQHIEWLASCALRAEARQTTFAFRNGRAWQRASPIPWVAPHLHLQAGEGLRVYRAVADACALRALHCDSLTHLMHAPETELPRMLYEWFEQLRCESLAPTSWQGVRENLRQHFAHWTLQFHASELIQTQLGQLLFTVCQMVNTHLSHPPPPEEVLDSMEATRANLASCLGHLVRAMALAREQQDRFSPVAAKLAHTVSELVVAEQARAHAYPADRASRKSSSFFLRLEAESEQLEPWLLASSGLSRSFQQASGRYRIFTSAYDRESRPGHRIRPALLRDYRVLLDQRMQAMHIPIARLGRQLSMLLETSEQKGWQFEQTEGRIDGRKLTRLLTTPAERALFRREAHQPQSHCAITLLLDCSGSMKTHAETLALFAEIWARMTQQAHTRFEVLGFSTGAWHGGRAKSDWQRAGSPPNAGRVAERLHLVFKSASDSLQRSRLALAALLKLDLYREGLDGEGVQWACERLQAQDVRRRILLVISDGCPMEAATEQANDSHYLDNHLKAVVQQYVGSGIEIIGIGLGLDLSPFYPEPVPLEPIKVLHPRSFLTLLRRIGSQSSTATP